MKHLIIICEGLTEINFCTNIIAPYLLQNYETHCQSVKIEKSGGGIVSWGVLKQQIKTHLRGKNCQSFVTTLIDLYGLPKDYYQDTKFDVELIEQRMYDQINNDRFIPYVQKYEFEALLFCSIDPFIERFDNNNAIKEIKQIINTFDNPENINNGYETSPSHRIKKILKSSYSKKIDGVAIAKQTGIIQIREKCPRFNNWIEKLTQLHK